MKLNLLYLKTGGGHFSTAKSIAEQFQKSYGNEVESILIDGLDQAPKAVKKMIEEGYSLSTDKAPLLWKSLYAMSMLKSVNKIERGAFSLLVKKHIREQIYKDKPDKIIILHFLLIKPVMDVLKEEKLKIPTLIVTTDPFTPPQIWFTENTAKFVVFSAKAKAMAIKKGVPEKNIAVFPITLNQKYSKKILPNKISALKQKYGFTPTKKLVLITGGGTGMPKGQKYLKNLLAHKLNAEFAIICGKNQMLKKSCQKIAADYPEINIKIYEFVDFMYELMNMADVVITKGGPASVMEGLMLEKPLIITSYIWAQEKGNVEFVIDNKAGFYETDPDKVSVTAKNLLNSKKLIAKVKTNIRNINILKSGSTDIVDFIYNLK